MTGRQITAGTASAGYRTEQTCRQYRADHRTDPGRRASCVCGLERAEHLPTPREEM